jgi:hypothetical protein
VPVDESVRVAVAKATDVAPAQAAAFLCAGRVFASDFGDQPNDVKVYRI